MVPEARAVSLYTQINARHPGFSLARTAFTRFTALRLGAVPAAC
jgi:hypothetical protein